MYRKLQNDVSLDLFHEQNAWLEALNTPRNNRGRGESGKVNLPILILMLLVNRTHEGSSGWQDLIDKDEDGLLW